jgi:hypothetical protein
MGEHEIERTGTQADLPLLTLSQRELSLLRMALDSGATANEISMAATSFIQSLRDRGVTGQDFEPLLEIPDADERVLELEPVATPHISHFQALVHYVLGVTGVPDGMENLHSQFHRQSIFTGRVCMWLGLEKETGVDIPPDVKWWLQKSGS